MIKRLLNLKRDSQVQQKVIEYSGAIGRLTMVKLARYGMTQQTISKVLEGIIYKGRDFSINPFKTKIRLLEIIDGEGQIKTYLLIGSTSMKQAQIEIPDGWTIARDITGSLAKISGRLFGESVFARRLALKEGTKKPA